MATSETLHRINRLVRGQRIKFGAALLADIARIRHTIVRVDPVGACNLRCGMCFFSSATWRTEHAKGRLTKSELERIASMLFPLAIQVHFGASMEPTTFKDYPWLVRLAKQHKVPFVGFTTNAQLLTSDGIRQLAAAGLDEITISSHGVHKDTYERLMRGASFEKHHETLRDLASVRSLNKLPRLRINFTINPDNLEELKSFFDVYGAYNLTTLQLRPVFDFADTEYRNNDLSKYLDRYRAITADIIREGANRRVHVLANVSDPTHEGGNVFAHVYRTAFLRAVSPEFVWTKDFDWRNESLADYCNRIGWRKMLLRQIIQPHRQASLPAAQTAAFDVF
ncbi:radical SAM protein [Microvirga terricola]|uniref:Radical SAM protein n=1 Tax=Microvirga terricola TaxID=2719797 RepID=A0ABX0VE27_9HYPH|nr:radical SAM protein [Microvirga terricola]NIX78085.1 radical SAM protein [Microvirga terricola]